MKMLISFLAAVVFAFSATAVMAQITDYTAENVTGNMTNNITTTPTTTPESQGGGPGTVVEPEGAPNTGMGGTAR